MRNLRGSWKSQLVGRCHGREGVHEPMLAVVRVRNRGVVLLAHVQSLFFEYLIVDYLDCVLALSFAVR